MSLGAVRAVLFDAGDTLLTQIEYDQRAAYARLIELSEDAGEVTAEVLGEAAQTLLDELLGVRRTHHVEITLGALNQLLLDRYGLRVTCDPAELEQQLWEAAVKLEPEPGVVDMLDSLAARHVPMGVVSNTMFTARPLIWELTRHGLIDYFSFVVTSADYGVCKPHSAIFLAACGRLGLPPEAVCYVGNSYDSDVSGARGAGLSAVWYNRAANTADEPVTQIASWAELPALLG